MPGYSLLFSQLIHASDRLNIVQTNPAARKFSGELKLISSRFQHNNKRKALCLPDFPSCHLLLAEYESSLKPVAIAA
jgi:hypothetical protein